MLLIGTIREVDVVVILLRFVEVEKSRDMVRRLGHVESRSCLALPLRVNGHSSALTSQQPSLGLCTRRLT